MFVTAVTGVVSVVIVYVAGFTFGLMIFVEAEELFMFEGGRYPGVLSMTLATVSFDLAMQVIDWIAVTTVALLLQGLFK